MYSNKRRRSSVSSKNFYGSAARIATRYAYKYLSSGTQTKQNRDFNHMASNQHTSVGSTGLTVVLNKKKPRHKGGDLRFYDGRSALVKNEAGVQIVRQLNVIGSRSQWLSEVPAISVTDDDLGPQPLIFLNPNVNNTGGPLITTSETDAVRMESLTLSNVGLTYDMSNTSTTGNFIYLYFVTPKVDTDIGPDVDWANAQLDIDYGKGASAFPTPGTSIMAPGFATTAQVGMKPTQFKLWNRKWRTLKVKKVELGSGASEKLSVQIKMNYIGHRNKLEASTEKYLANKTVIVFAVQHGSVCVDTTADPSGIATYSSSQTAVCSQIKYLLHPAYAKTDRLDYAVAQSRIPTNTLVANQRIVDTKDAIVSVQGASN